jgi:16S rRNA (uracil1498-N3)-methyltransferase
MRRRWIADQFDESTASLLGENAAHLGRVLRARVGQQFDLACGGEVRVGTITAVAEDAVVFALGERVEQGAETEITLVLAIYKFDRLEWAIEKCTELGATRIVPVIARRTDAHLAAAAEKRVERWRRIAHEAAQQSRRLRAPEIDAPRKLREIWKLDFIEAASLRLLLNEDEKKFALADAMAANPSSVMAAIGPEGGWSSEELEQFASAGWSSVTLGERILRAETAAIAALAVIEATLAGGA